MSAIDQVEATDARSAMDRSTESAYGESSTNRLDVLTEQSVSISLAVDLPSISDNLTVQAVKRRMNTIATNPNQQRAQRSLSESQSLSVPPRADLSRLGTHRFTAPVEVIQPNQEFGNRQISVSGNTSTMPQLLHTNLSPRAGVGQLGAYSRSAPVNNSLRNQGMNNPRPRIIANIYIRPPQSFLSRSSSRQLIVHRPERRVPSMIGIVNNVRQQQELIAKLQNTPAVSSLENNLVNNQVSENQEAQLTQIIEEQNQEHMQT